MVDLLNFTAKTAVVTGAAAGMGQALTAQLVERGATVHAIDVASITARGATSHECDLRDLAALDDTIAALPATVDAVFNCAGLPNGGRFTPVEIMQVNWLALRHLTEALLPRMPDNSAVVHVASTAGRAWPERTELHAELMAAETWPAGLAWIESHLDVIGDGYSFSKEAVQYYTMWKSLQTITNGVRMNSICPGVTNTQIYDDFRRGVGDEVLDRAVEVAGRLAEPHEMAPPMLFLADPVAASYVNGVNLNVDHGTGAAHLTGQW